MHVKPLMEWFAEHLQDSTWLDTVEQYKIHAYLKEYTNKHLYEDTTNPIPANPLTETQLKAEVTSWQIARPTPHSAAAPLA